MAETILQSDDNLQGGITYTFSFTLQNWIHTPGVATLQADIAAQAPSFVSSPVIAWSSMTLVLNVTFVYNGDGSDVVGDVANEIIAAFQAGSGDNFSFEQATQGTAGITAFNAIPTVTAQAASTVGQAAGNAVGATVGGVTQGLTSGITSSLGVSGWIVVVLVILGVLAYFSASTGLRLNK